MIKDNPPMEFTGERFTPECVREMAYEHWHRYAWVASLTKDKVILDVACGEGYGSYLLAKSAQSVVGVDLDEAAIEHAKAKYQSPNLEFMQGNALSLPIESGSVDLIVSFETIEHLDDHDALLTEFKRVLRPDGHLILSSPDKASYTDETGYDNPFHLRELYRDELEALLGRHFKAYQLFGQKLTFVSAIWPLSQSTSSNQAAAVWLTRDHIEVAVSHTPDHPPLYFLAIASMSEQESVVCPLSLFTDQEETVYRHYQEEIRHHMASGELLATKDKEIAELKRQLAGRPWWMRVWSGLFR